MRASRLTFPAALIGCLLALTSLRAAEGGFTATLSNEQKNVSGLVSLTPAELTALDQIVADEVGLARQQNLGEFSENFVARRSDEQRQLAGLNRLTAEQQARLNELVAAAIASRAKPKDRPRIRDSEVLLPARPPEIHGSVTLSYGWGRGGSIRGESLWLDYYDPESRVGIGVGIANYSGNGFYDYYPSDGYGSRYAYDGAPLYYGVSSREGFARGTGQSFCAPAGRGFGRH
jgi:hypothetical protein